MKPFRRTTKFPARAALLAFLTILPAIAFSQSYPGKPVHAVVPFVPGSGGDLAARLVAYSIAALLGQPIVVDNRPGAGESIGADTVVRAAPDGYTLLICSANGIVFRPFLTKVVSYDSLRDFTPITQIADAVATVVVNPAFPANSLKELIDYAKSHPGKITYGTSGIGTSHHLSAEEISQMTGVSMVHAPYKSGVEPLNDMMAGRIEMSYAIMSTLIPRLQTGKIRVIAVVSDQRNRRLPDVPTVAETLPAFKVPPAWFGFFGPARLPEPILRRLNADAVKAIRQPEVSAKLEAVGFDVVGSTPETFAADIRGDVELVSRIVKAAGIKPTD